MMQVKETSTHIYYKETDRNFCS